MATWEKCWPRCRPMRTSCCRPTTADTIVVCAGQEPERTLADQLAAKGLMAHVVGGARLAGELDAKRAMSEGAAIGHAL